MALQLIYDIDKLGEAFNDVNNNTKEQFIDFDINNGIFSAYRYNGTQINLTLPIPTAGGQVLSPIGSITLGSTAGFYNQLTITPVEYLYNSIRYSIPTSTVLNLSNNTSGQDRLDGIYIDPSTNTIITIEGIPGTPPILPNDSTKVLVGAIYVRNNANSTTPDKYILVYSAFTAQQIQNEVNQPPQVVNLGDLADVDDTIPTNNQVLTWDSTDSLWKPSTITLPSGNSANNGIQVNGTSGIFQLGGDLIQNTEINLQGNDLIITNGTTGVADFSNYYLIYNDTIKLDWQNGRIYDGFGKYSILSNNRQLLNSNNQLRVDWEASQLYALNGLLSLDWYQRTLVDYEQNTSLDWQLRTIHSTTGSVSIEYGNPDYITVNNELNLVGNRYIQFGANDYTSAINFYQDPDNKSMLFYVTEAFAVGAPYTQQVIDQNFYQIKQGVRDTDFPSTILMGTNGSVSIISASNTTENFFANLNTNLLTTDRNYEFPDNSGTLALLSDISGGGISGTNGIEVSTSGVAGLGGNYIHLSDYIRNPFDYTYTQTTSTLNDYQYILNFKNYSSSGSEIYNTNYNYYNDSLYFTLKNGSIIYGMSNVGITFDSPNTQIYLQNNNLFFNTQNSAGTEKVRVSASQYSGLNSDITYNDDSSQFRSAPNYFTYSSMNSDSSNSINFGAYQYQFYYHAKNDSQEYTLQANNSFQYNFNDSSNSDNALLRADTSSLVYNNTNYETEVYIGSGTMLIKTGDKKHIENRVLYDNNENQVLDWNNGYIKQTYTVISNNYSVLSSDYFIEVHSSTNNITITLPSATTNLGKELIIKHNNVNYNSIIAAQSGELIDGDTYIVLASTYANVKLISNGTKWLMISI